MTSTCIITDSSVQFSKHTFPGRNLVFQVPFRVKFGNDFVENDPLFKVSSLPTRLEDENCTDIIAPSVQDCLEAIEFHSKTYKEIITIFMSSQLTEAFQNMELASKIKPGKISLSVIDSQTTSVGLGALVQLAAENVVKGTKFIDIERKIRGKIPKIYSQFCISNLSYLQRTNFLSKPQAMLGEMLNILPVFAFEEGRMVSVEKVKNFRLLLENYQEFVDEFNDLEQVALVQSQPPLIHETHSLREHVSSSFPGTPFIELTINLALAALFGPAAVGIFAIEGRS
jgi:DegV family protein with EDD domain